MDKEVDPRTHFVSKIVEKFITKLKYYRMVKEGERPAKDGLLTSALVTGVTTVTTTASAAAAVGITGPEAQALKATNFLPSFTGMFARAVAFNKYKGKAKTISDAFSGIEDDTLSLALCEAGLCIFESVKSTYFGNWRGCDILPNLSIVAVEAVDRMFHCIAEQNFIKDKSGKIGTAEVLLNTCFNGKSKSVLIKRFCQGISYSDYLQKHFNKETQKCILSFCQNDKIKTEASDIAKHISQESRDPFSVLRTGIEDLTELMEEQGNIDEQSNKLIVEMHEMLQTLSISKQSHDGQEKEEQVKENEQKIDKILEVLTELCTHQQSRDGEEKEEQVKENEQKIDKILEVLTELYTHQQSRDGEEKDKLPDKTNEVPPESESSEEDEAGVTFNSQLSMPSEKTPSQNDEGRDIPDSEPPDLNMIDPVSAYRSDESAVLSTPESVDDRKKDAVDAKRNGTYSKQKGISSKNTSMQVPRKEGGAVVPPMKQNPYEELNASSDKGKDVRTIYDMTGDEIRIIKRLDIECGFEGFFKRFPKFKKEDLQAAKNCFYGGQDPALSFLEVLRSRYPGLTMEELVKDASDLGRKDIAHFFKTKKIELSCILFDLSDEALKELALKLGGGIDAPPATATWEDFACRYEFSPNDVKAIKQSQVKKNKTSPTDELFYKLQCNDPTMTVTKLKYHLFDAGFQSIAHDLDLLE